MKRFQLCLFLLLSTIAASTLYGQGTTTSSLTGVVTGPDGEALIGANVTAVHEPTGTFYGTSTDLDGSYIIPNMKIGGPYTLKSTYTGYGEKVINGVYLQLAKQQRQDFGLQEAAIELTGVEVIAKAGGSGQNAGAATQIKVDAIENLPTVDRDLNDFMRLTPQASTQNGGISFAGMNNRYNAVYIDGAVNNDVFGLAGSGTNGGQTGISPISVDAIDQIAVMLSPYDVSLGGFAGGGVNMVTKSGTNEFKGTAYYFWQNQNTTGKTNGELVDRGVSDERLDEFSVKQYGLSLGGPIIKNKLFFFTNVEIQDDQVPLPFNPSEYQGNTDVSGLTSLRNTLRERYGYEAGEFGDKTETLEGTKFFGKINWNINDRHKLTLRHQYTRGENFSPSRSSANRIIFENSAVDFPSTTNSTALELNSQFSNKASNNLIIAYTDVDDDRGPAGQAFPYVTIFDGAGGSRIEFGSEQFSTANQLRQKIFTITDNFKLYRGDHTWTFGTHNEFYDIRNVFIRQNFGSYQYGSLQDFLAGGAPARYDRSYSLIDDGIGDNTDAAAEFNAMQLGLYAQDEWSVNNKLTLTLGLRLDVPIITSDPDVHPTFNTETMPAIRQFYEVDEDVLGGQSPDAQLMISPRLGFNYDIDGTGGTVLRGGLGIFTSRVPFVWPGAMFNNNGITVGGFRDTEGAIATEFRADPNDQYTAAVAVPSGQVDLFAPDFKYPQVFRSSLALDKYLGNGLSASIEGIYTKILNNVVYTNINSNPTTDFIWTTDNADRRTVTVGQDIDDRYNGIYLAGNTDEGYTYNVTASINKEWENGFNAYLAWTYNDAEAVNEGTSSQNSSQWRGQINIDGRNNPVLGRSDFSVGHRFIGALSYDKDWDGSDNWTTSVSLVYEGQSGEAYSYVIGGRSGQNIAQEVGSTTRNRTLIYVPTDASDINLVESNGVSVEEQWRLLNEFIEQDDHLSERRGQYAEKNGARGLWNSRWDLAIRQNVGTLIGETANRLQFSMDVQNFANLLNKDWGVRYFAPGENVYELYNFEGYAADGTTPQFSYTDDRLGDDRYNINDVASRWTIRFGLRYLFN